MWSWRSLRSTRFIFLRIKAILDQNIWFDREFNALQNGIVAFSKMLIQGVERVKILCLTFTFHGNISWKVDFNGEFDRDTKLANVSNVLPDCHACSFFHNPDMLWYSQATILDAAIWAQLSASFADRLLSMFVVITNGNNTVTQTVVKHRDHNIDTFWNKNGL